MALRAGRTSLCLRELASLDLDEDGLRLAAEAQLAAGLWRDALVSLAQLAPPASDQPDVRLARARALARLGSAQEALAVLTPPPELPEALALAGELRLGLGASDEHAAEMEERARRWGDRSPGLWLQAGQAWCQVAERSQDEALARQLSRQAVECLERHWQSAGPSAEAAEWLSRAMIGAQEPGLKRLELVAEGGKTRPQWHVAYLRALLNNPGDDALRSAQQAAEKARSLFPHDPQIAHLAEATHQQAWAQRRRLALAQRSQPGQDDDPTYENAPDFLADLRARIRRGSLQPTREVPDRQREIIEVLCRYERANAIVTGPPGCGKSALLRAVAHQLQARKGVPAMLHAYGLFELDPIGIVGGTDNVGVLEGRLTALSRFCENNKIILFIDNFHLILGAGSYTGRPAGLSELLQPLMSSGNVKIIGACNDESYDSLMRSVGLERRMTRVRLPAMKVDEATELLSWLRPRLEDHYALRIPDELLPLTSRMAEYHIKLRALPDSAIDLLERASAKALVDDNPAVSQNHLLSALAQLLLVPLEQVRLDRMTRLLRLEELLSQKVIGQPQAIRAVADVIRMSKAELDLNPARPDGVFLFVGPSGVGKTELARALADILNTDESAFVRLDMSEFSEPHNVSRLFGTTPGYVGFEQEGQLTASLRLNPGAVILLDEIEKAHPKVYDVFLQVFDAGRMTDGRGKVVDCSHATFIMTSNLGTAELAEGRVGFLRGRETQLDRERVVRTSLERHFRPEFLNRLDAIVVFEPLLEETLHSIIAQKLAMMRARFASKHMEVSFDEALVPLLASQTDRLRTGARGVLRAIEQRLVVPLTREVLAHQGRHRFRVHVLGNEIKIEALLPLALR